MNTDQDLYNQLSYYTLAHTDPDFIHQYVLDAYAAQHADRTTKPIVLAFALAGLYLHNEKGYSGKEVQNAHTQLAKKRKQFPTFTLPENRGDITIKQILQTPPGTERDQEIQKWSATVWKAYQNNHKIVADWLQLELHI